MDFRQEHDPSPIDFDLEQEVALYGFQQQVRNRTIRPSEADMYMRKVLGGYYYDDFSEQTLDGKVIIDGQEG